MSCHQIGEAMNSVVDVVLFEGFKTGRGPNLQS